mgnify:CR=1 FL=1
MATPKRHRQVAHRVSILDLYDITSYRPRGRSSGTPDITDYEALEKALSRVDYDSEDPSDIESDVLDQLSNHSQDSNELSNHMQLLENVVTHNFPYALNARDGLESALALLDNDELNINKGELTAVLESCLTDIEATLPEEKHYGTLCGGMSAEMREFIDGTGMGHWMYFIPSRTGVYKHFGNGYTIEWTGSSLHMVLGDVMTDSTTFSINDQALYLNGKRHTWETWLEFFEVWTRPTEEEALLFTMVHPGTQPLDIKKFINARSRHLIKDWVDI